jgi:hypothetical protein
MDYRPMQGQPPSSPRRTQFGSPVGLAQRRRAILVGGLMAIVGLAILLRPQVYPSAPMSGSDPATLAGLINMPAMPNAVQWKLTPASTDADPRDLSKGRWTLDADLTFAPADAAKIAGPQDFFKPPFKAGKLQRLDASHLRLTLTSA